MIGSPPLGELSDERDREIAVATFDRNIIVTAGAGTGKTTLLVDRLVHLLLRNPDPLKITDIAALTFTNKAANEMKIRLRERLQTYLEVDPEGVAEGRAAAKAHQEVRMLIDRYRLSKDDLDRRAHEALRNIERSDIGTIHSFAATLLRLYPLEAGVDPQFGEDEGPEFERAFAEQWSLWLDEELTLAAGRADDWRAILRKLPLAPVQALAQSLCSEAIALARDPQSSTAASESLISWLKTLAEKAATLLDRHPEDRLNEKLVRAALSVIREQCPYGEPPGKPNAQAQALLADKTISRGISGWAERDVAEAQELARVAKGLGAIDAGLTDLLWAVLAPFAARFREVFVREGFLSFDALLMRARDLVRDHAAVREELKRHYRAILIDEFQDTDPIQYEILLYLAERPGSAAGDWRKVKLAPGKIFVVGDPKQSIYAFRRADIEAYLEVVEKIIKAQNGIECRLTTNFRSNAAILNLVNGVFTAVMQAREGLQPPYLAIHPAPGRLASATGGVPGVVIRKTVSAGGAIDAQTARRLEGESLARWLSEELLGKAEIPNAQGATATVQPKDVALLLRKLTDIHDYLEPLRRHNIRYVVEGERHFYAAKEIIDAVNLLRAVDNPHDRVALVGVLRSPLGGLDDRQIYELHHRNLLDFRCAERVHDKDFPTPLAEFYRILARLHDETRMLPVGAAVTHVFSSLPIKLLAACHFHGEQAVANIEKLRQQAELLGRAGVITLKEAIRQLERRVLEIKEDGESVLAEENVDAVRIMSIHKAKGLEFPVVVLAGCHAGADGRRATDGEALFDWSSGLTGTRVGQSWDLPGLYIAEKVRMRTEEEQKRLLYVAMTRARERLVISCAPADRRSSGSFLSMLDDVLGGAIESAQNSKSLSIGEGIAEIQIASASLTAPGKARSKASHAKRHWAPLIEIWQKRRARFALESGKRPFTTPTLLKRQEEELTEAKSHRAYSMIPRATALIVGELAHRFLQEWDLGTDTDAFHSRLNPFVAHWLAEKSFGERRDITTELEKILSPFFHSAAYRELAGARILGREVPLLMPWGDSVMEGVIDLIYEHNGLLYLADYKTDRIERKDLRAGPERYRHQAEIYSRAARQSLNREVAAFKLIFLCLGETVEVDLNANKELWLF
ncbi:MAG: UvrD-helicase domain-containing protein [Alphaproteobacteria bacterium]